MTVEQILPPASRAAEAQWGAERIDLDAYFQRIGYLGPTAVEAETLRQLHRAHVGAICFENLDVLFGREVSLEVPNLQEKLVASGRGGYCFEQNLLFAAVLERLGFSVRRMLGRVRRGSDRIRYRSHAALLVAVDGRTWLADVGFGDEGLLEPIELAEAATAVAGDWTWRVDREHDGEWVLRCRHPDGWFDVYALALERHFKVDFEVAHFYTAHHPRSTFVGRLVVQRGTEHARYTLTDHVLVTRRADGRCETAELSGAEVIQAIRHVFGIRMSTVDERLLGEYLAAPRPGRSGQFPVSR